jgi:ubiquinone/menaquinone biosynthesis C-methylase UbiE
MKELICRSELQTKLTLVKAFHEEEKEFWSHYAKFYYYLERADPYKKLIDDFSKNLPDIIRGKWIDLGSGSGAIVQLLTEKIKNPQFEAEIFGTDIEPRMLEYLSGRFNKNKNVNIKKLDLALSFDFSENYFDGITANLILSYLIHHEGEIGEKGFIKLLKDVYGILKPGGVFIWSTPKKNVNFFKVFAASWKNILDPSNLDHLYYGPAIFKQALQIQNKGKKGIYHFLDIKYLEKILSDIGFTDIKFTRSMAGQVDIISCKKPLKI